MFSPVVAGISAPTPFPLSGEVKPSCRSKFVVWGDQKQCLKLRKSSLTLLVLCLLVLSGRTEAGRQRETEEPTPSPPPTNLPTLFPTFTPTTSPSRSPTATPTIVPTSNPLSEPTLVPTTDEPTLTLEPTTDEDDDDDLYLLDIPEMRLAFAMPPNTGLAPAELQQDWQLFLTGVLQAAVGLQVQEWTAWDSDVTYTTVSGSGVAQTEGQVSIKSQQDTTIGQRRLNQTVTQTQLETDLYDYFIVWGVDDMWGYFVNQGYPITSLSLQFSDNTFSPRRAPPESLSSFAPREGGSGDDSRNAWIAGVVMAVVVVIAISVVALLYLQRRGRQTAKTSEAASPRTMAVSDPASPDGGAPRGVSDPEGQKSPKGSITNMIVTRAPSEDVSSVPGFSESSFLYDASRLDQVIDSARGYELPYAVPPNTFSDLTNDIKDITQNDEEDEEEDSIIEVPQASHQDNKDSARVNSYEDIAYSPSLFDDEKKESESKL